MLRQIKPRTARSKRALEQRAPKVVENPKTALILRGSTCSQVVQDLLADLYLLRQPLAKRFTKKNEIHPFDDPASFEFFSEKNDTSLIVFGSSSKKRPHTITLARTFGHKILDMLELHLDASSFRRISQFKTRKVAVGQRPLLVFAGTAFESPVSNEWTTAKSLLLDFFRGENADKMDVEGIQHVVCVNAEEPTTGDSDLKPALHIRTYLIKTKRSAENKKLPLVELEEMGPRMSFRLGRCREPDASMLKEAMRKAKTNEERTKKNISTDGMGDKLGRIHLGKQDLSELQTRKMKGLKRGRNEEDGNDEDAVNGEESRRKRKV